MYRPRGVARRRVYKARVRRGTAPKRTLRKMVKREIARNVENKTFQVFDDNYDILPSNSPGFDANIIPVTPYSGAFLTISQGLGQGQRVGNRIKVKKLTFKGCVYPKAYNVTTNPTPAPVQIKFWFFYDKEEPQAIPTPQTSGDFLQFGNTALGLGNRLFDQMAPVNTDRYRVLTTRTVKVGYSTYGGTGATGSLPLQGNLSNNDFKMNANVSVDLMPYIVKDVVFRDAATTPTTRGVFMMAQAVYANGSPLASTTIPAEMNWMSDLEFEDA